MTAAADQRPFRFGVQARGTGVGDGAAWREQARRVESLGYSTLTMPDHFDDQLAPIPALMAAAAATTTLRVGALVLANDYRHPVVVASSLATLDVLSDGRLEVGLGAGWSTSDYAASGISFDRPGVRIDRLEATLDVLDGAFAGEPFSITGEHVTVTDYTATPRPRQQPRPPLLIGGGGRRMLQVAARRADIVGINGNLQAGEIGRDAVSTMTREAVVDKVDIVRAAAGERLGAIELNVRVFLVAVTDDPQPVIDSVAAMFDVPADVVAESPFSLVGPVPSIVEEICRLREDFGFSYVIVGDDVIDSFAPVVAALA